MYKGIPGCWHRPRELWWREPEQACAGAGPQRAPLGAVPVSPCRSLARHVLPRLVCGGGVIRKAANDKVLLLCCAAGSGVANLAGGARMRVRPQPRAEGKGSRACVPASHQEPEADLLASPRTLHCNSIQQHTIIRKQHESFESVHSRGCAPWLVLAARSWLSATGASASPTSLGPTTDNSLCFSRALNRNQLQKRHRQRGHLRRHPPRCVWPRRGARRGARGGGRQGLTAGQTRRRGRGPARQADSEPRDRVRTAIVAFNGQARSSWLNARRLCWRVLGSAGRLAKRLRPRATSREAAVRRGNSVSSF